MRLKNTKFSARSNPLSLGSGRARTKFSVPPTEPAAGDGLRAKVSDDDDNDGI